MTVGSLRKTATAVAAMMATALLLAACSNANSTAGSGSSSGPVPGVTSNSVTVGAVLSLSGEFSQGVGNMLYGEEAYFKMVDSEGGVDGKKIDLPSSLVLDDATNPTTDADDIRTLISQDHVFSILIGSAVFDSSTYLAQSGTPTFGYNEGGGWSGPKNLFAENGDVLYYPGAVPTVAFVAKQLHLDSVAVVAYPFDATSHDACNTVAQGLQQAGINVSFEDLNLGLDEDPTSDVQKMAQSHVDMLYSCTDGAENLKFVQAMQLYGLKNVYTIWDNGYNTSFVTPQDTVEPSLQSVLTNSIFFLEHVPFQASEDFPSTYPGMNQYISTMKKYEPAYTYDDYAYWGWASGANLVQGIKEVAAEGKPLNQANLVNAINAEAGFNANGTMDPILPTWGEAHTVARQPFCSSEVLAMSDGTLKNILVQSGDQTINCFDSSTATTPEKPLPAHVPPNS